MSMSQRNGCHVFYVVSRGHITDNFNPRTFATPQIKEACVRLFKLTPEEMCLKIDAFVTAGLSGVLKMSGQNKPTRTRAEIRELVLTGLREWPYIVTLGWY